MNIKRRDFLGYVVVGSGASLLCPLQVSATPLLLDGATPATPGEEVITTCNMCYLGCSVIATVEGGKRILLRGNPESPVNRGKLCAKGNAGVYKAAHPERIKHPMVRVGKRGEGQWRRISWEEALRTIAEALGAIAEDHGPESIALWHNVDLDRLDIYQRFMFALGSPNILTQQSACDSSLHIGAGLVLGEVRTVPDFANAECIVVLGHNPLGARDLVLATRTILEAKARGARLIVVDPRFTESAAHAHLWLPVRPGTDGILMAGFANYLIRKGAYDKDYVERHTFGFGKIAAHLAQFEVEPVCRVTGLSEAQFLNAADSMIGKRTLVDVARGVAAQPDGTYAAFMAIILNALLGSIDRKGGRLTIPWPPVELADVEPRIPRPTIERIDGANAGLPLPVGKRAQNPVSVMGIGQNVPEHILSEKPYPLKALIVSSVNPVYSLPNGGRLVEAFDKLKLLVAIDPFLSETAHHADLLLPAASYLETNELWFPTHPSLSLRQPVIEPRWESRASQDIIIDLAKAMGLEREFPFANYREFLELQLEGTGISMNQLTETGFVDLGHEPGELLEKGFDTPSGRIELFSSVLSFSGFSPVPIFAKWPAEKQDDDYPLYLITYKLPYQTNAITGCNPYLNAIQQENLLLMNPRAAARFGVGLGDAVTLESARGKVQVKVELTEGIHPETVALSHHFGHTAFSQVCLHEGVSPNPVIKDGTDPLGGNVTFNATRVKVTKS
jgi:thiosulfate reductase/polysulfide reductase chain A